MIAFQLMRAYRKTHGLGFKIVNQIHDAVLLMVPENEVEQTKEMLYATMGNIVIPIKNNPLKLGIDIDVMPERWGEKEKE